MTSIQSCRYLCKEYNSENFSGSSTLSKSSYNKLPADPSIVNFVIDSFGLFIAKYIKKNLKKILKIVLEACISPFNRSCKKLLKAKLYNIYYDKFYIEYYNFY